MADSTQEDLQDRLTKAEQDIAELRRLIRDQAAQIVDLLAKNRTQTEIDSAMLARIDSFIESQNRSERRQIAGFDALIIGQKNLETGQKNLEASVAALEKGFAGLVDVARDHKEALTSQAQAIAALATGQEQIIQLLTTRKSPLND